MVEVIPGMNNITVMLRNPASLALDAIERLQRWWEESEAVTLDSRQIEIPVIYGGEHGPDLADVARHTGLSEQQVVERHASADYITYFIGFQPGFPYLGGLPTELATPRRAEPRLAVPAGSVGIGGSQTGIYPLPTPVAGKSLAVPIYACSTRSESLRRYYSQAIGFVLCRLRRACVRDYSRRDEHHLAGRRATRSTAVGD